MSAEISSTETSDDGPFYTSKPWRPEDLAAVRERVYLVPQSTRRLAELRVDWLEADRDEQAATTYGDEAARADATWRKTEVEGQILAEQVRLADDWAATAREVDRVRPGVLADLVLAGLRAAAKFFPVELAKVLKPLVTATLEILLEPVFTHLTRRWDEQAARTAELAARVADLEEVVVKTRPANPEGNQ